jgi:hypothetical protein
MTFVGSELAVRCRYHEWLPGKGDRASVPARTLHDLPHTPLQEAASPITPSPVTTSGNSNDLAGAGGGELASCCYGAIFERSEGGIALQAHRI